MRHLSESVLVAIKTDDAHTYASMETLCTHTNENVALMATKNIYDLNQSGLILS